MFSVIIFINFLQDLIPDFCKTKFEVEYNKWETFILFLNACVILFGNISMCFISRTKKKKDSKCQ